MKKCLPTFLAGMLTMAIVSGLAVSALAATGSFTITVDPINIQVNGTTFAPKDTQGNSVPVFALNGTTYAPLRALAEAYGLEVGYDAKVNMATVSSNQTAASQTTNENKSKNTFDHVSEIAKTDFSSLWYTLDPKRDSLPSMRLVYLIYDEKTHGLLSEEELKDILNALDEQTLRNNLISTATKAFETTGYAEAEIYFSLTGSGTPFARLWFPDGVIATNSFMFPIV